MSIFPKVILFDGHGTLTFPKRSRMDVYKELADQQGVSFDEEKAKACIGIMRKRHVTFLQDSMKNQKHILWQHDRDMWFSLEAEVFTALGFKGDYKLMSESILADFMNPLQQGVFPEVKEVLTFLKSKEIQLGVLTNSDSRYRDILQFHQIDHFFEDVIISQEVMYKKPGPQIFCEAYKRFSIGGYQAWYIGDQYRLDVTSSLEAAIGKAFLVLRSREQKDFYEGCKIIDDLNGIKDYILSLE